ncbi:MAG: SDR family oxidoreductase [Burkholderiaceae bacterium]|nr:SDR family oxidoreductase [Burkholderiaceae bacterium]
MRRLLIAESQPTTDGAVATLTRSPGMEPGSCGIRVVEIAPRFVATEGHAASAKDMAEFIVGKAPLGRVGQPADIAAAVACAGFAEWGWIAGTMIDVACGMCSLHGVWQRGHPHHSYPQLLYLKGMRWHWQRKSA